MGEIGGALLSILSGGATGLLGVIFQRYADYKNKQLDLQLIDKKNVQELAMRDKDAEISKQEWTARTQVAQVEGDTAKDVEASKVFAASYSMEPQRYATGDAPKNGWGVAGWFVLTLVDAFRGMIRPALTLYLCVLVTKLYFEAKLLIDKEDLDTEQAYAMMQNIVNTVLYLWTTVTLWWFGTRNQQAAPTKAK